MNKNFKPVYKLALLAQSSKYEKLAKLLVSSLGLPQVGVYLYSEVLPPECELFVLFGENTWCENSKNELKFRGKIVFSPAMGYLCESDNSSVFYDKKGIYQFPQKLIHKYVPGKPTAEDGVHNILRLSLYYTLKFIKKSSLCKSSDCIYALIVSLLMIPHDVAYCYELLMAISSKGEKIFDNLEYLLKDQITLKTKGDVINLVKKILLNCNINKSNDDLMFFLYHALQYLIEGFSCEQFNESIKSNPFHKVEYLELRIQKATNASQLAYYGSVALFQNYISLVELAKKRILNEYYDSQTCYIKSSISGTGYCYSPLLSILLSLSNKNILDLACPIIKTTTVNFKWCVVSQALLKEDIIEISSFFDMDKLQFSQSLIENLEKSLCVPSIPDGYQYERTKDSYSNAFLSLQKAWEMFLMKCIHKLGDECILVSPWPEKKEFALSIRYDVDRPVTWNMISNISRLQIKYNETPFATWFFFEEGANKEQQIFLKNSLQEVGLHVLSNKVVSSDIVGGVGITYHCGPNSSYWPGKSIFMVQNNQIKYTEFLSIQIGRPVLLFLEDFLYSKWISPLHISMEKGTQLSNDREGEEHLDKVNSLIQMNGHIILGSHPDIDQSHMDNLLKNINIEVGWLATIGEVVKRCKKVLNYGNIYVYYNKKNTITMYGKYFIRNLQVKIISRDDAVRYTNFNLNAFEAKNIPLNATTL